MPRWVFAIVMVIGCRGTDAPAPEPDARPPNRDETGGCGGNPPCPMDLVCTRFQHFCLPADSVYTVHVRWTVRGQRATVTTCAPQPDLSIGFKEADDLYYGYGAAPVPCSAGLFSVDQVNRTITDVVLGAEGGSTDTFPHATIDPVTGDAMIDLDF